MPNKTKGLIISASQLETASDCLRKWWFERVARLPTKPRDYFTFGTVMHACLERWLLADDRGRVPEPVPEQLEGQTPGAAVEVFPAGWETATERDGSTASVTPNEAKLIRKLVKQAIERGIVRRVPGREVESDFLVRVIEGVQITGFLDLLEPGDDGLPVVVDHKSFSKGGAPYLKRDGPEEPIAKPYEKDDGTSPNCVGHNQQMLTYAAVVAERTQAPAVRVRHNQFPKFNDPKGPRQVEAVVEAGRLREHWRWIQEMAETLERVSKIKRWEDTPPPSSTAACAKYKGCDFLGICGRRETPAVYLQRVGNLKKAAVTTTRPNVPLPTKGKQKSEASIMDIFAKARAKQAGQQAPASAPAINGAPEPEVVETTETEAAQAVAGPPWANPACPACKGKGFTSKGKPCSMCDAVSKRQGGPVSGQYVVDTCDDGFLAVALEEHAEALEAAGHPTEWVESVEAASQPAAPKAAPTPVEQPAPKAAPKQAPKATPAARRPVDPKLATAKLLADPTTPDEVRAQVAEEIEEVEASAPSESRGAGRPRVGITLLIGAAQLRGKTRPTTTIQEVLAKWGQELATDMGAKSYWELDTWKRRDRICQKADEIAEALGRTIIMVPATTDPDCTALVSALIASPFTEGVFEGLR